MPTQLENVTQQLREMILSGKFPAGARIAEIPLAEQLGVSRTPIRLALATLEQEGLLVSAPRRGFAVREFTADEVADAIEVRGQLEAMAARIAAERGLSDEHRRTLEESVAEGRSLLNDTGAFCVESRIRWIEINTAFHDTVVAAAGNAVLEATLQFVGRIPLTSPAAIIFNTAAPDYSREQLRRAHADHEAVLDALINRQGTRAAALMGEHAYRSSANKRRNFAEMKAHAWPGALPGLDLVRDDNDEDTPRARRRRKTASSEMKTERPCAR